MTDYTELVNALRDIEKTMFALGTSSIKMDNVSIRLAYDKKWGRTAKEAADAIERLIAERDEAKTDLAAVGRAYIRDIEQHEPKQGEWIEENRRPRSSQFVCSECHRTAYDPQPTRDKAWRKRCRYAYCPNCGAKMNDSNASNASNELNALGNAQDGPIVTPCCGCSDYDGYGGCKSKGGCARARMEVQDA